MKNNHKMFSPFSDIEDTRIKCLEIGFPQDHCDMLADQSKLVTKLMILMIILFTLFPLIFYAKHSNRI